MKMQYLCALSAIVCTTVTPTAAQPIEYPEARRVDASDTLHGETILDPYRWMEDQKSDETVDWVRAQDALFLEYVGSDPLRDSIEKRIAEIGDFTSASAPRIENGRWFYSRFEPASSKSTIYWRDGEHGQEHVLIDQKQYFESEDERITNYTPSPNGRHIALGVDQGAGTWGHIRIINVESGEEVSDRLVGVSGPFSFPGVQWVSDGERFAYFHVDVRDVNGDDSLAVRNLKINMHHIGTTQTEDPVLYARPDRPDALVNSLALTTDDRYLITSLTEKAVRRTVHYAIDLTDPKAMPVVMVDSMDRFSHITNHGSLQIYLTDSDAPNWRVVGIDPDAPEESNWIELIPEAGEVLTTLSATQDYLIARYDIDAKPVLRIFNKDGENLREASLPGIGGVGLTTNTRNNEVYYSFGVLFDPGTIYKLDPGSGNSELVFRPELAFNPDDFVIEQVFFSSFDGTRIPMFIAHKRGMEFNEPKPLWMYAFGNGGWVAFPWFQRHLVAWLDMGGVYALPNIRGGGEYGAEWQEAGTLHNKTNTIKDYIAASEWLIENGYTSNKLLVANGGSGSGPLPAIAVNQRPDLFGAAVVDFPFLDMMRYHLHTSGFTRSYGDPKVKDDFDVLRSYSPYHNIRENACYPPVLVTVAEEDQSTKPLHCYKHVARLQYEQACDNPILLQVIWDAGHYSYGTDRPTGNTNFANQITFAIKALGLSEGID